jgi:hypothetical protein
MHTSRRADELLLCRLDLCRDLRERFYLRNPQLRAVPTGR